MKFLRRCYDWIMELAPTPWALATLSIMSFAEASFFPIPPDPLLIAMAVAKPKKALWYALWCSVASIFGGLFGYLIGLFLWDKVGHFFFEYIPGFTPEAFAKIEEWYAHWGFWCVFTAGFTPIPYKLFTIASGVCHMVLLPFILASAISRSARFFLVAGLIRIFGEKIKTFIDKYFNILSVAFVVLLLGCFVLIGMIKTGSGTEKVSDQTNTSEVSK